MASAGPKVERQFRAQLVRERSDRLEVRALTVNRALDIGSRLRTELRLDDFLMRLNHHRLLSSRE